MRIVQRQHKILYVAAGLIAPFVIVEWWIAPVSAVLGWSLYAGASLAVVFVGVRIFRGVNEEVAPPRAWWRWTARPTAGFVLGGVSTASLILGVPIYFSGDPFWVDLRTEPAVLNFVLDSASSLICAIGYLNSSVRLIGRSGPNPELLS